jgi:hypothetical protein
MSTIYNGGLGILSPTSFGTDDIRVLLATASYVANKDHKFVSSITNELSATNYVRKALASKTVTQDDTNDLLVYDAADVLWAALGTSTPTQAIIFKQVTNDADSRLIACVDLVSPLAANGTDYTVVWSTSGIIRLSQG